MDDAAEARQRLPSLKSEVHVWLQRTEDALDSDCIAAMQALLDGEESRRQRRLLREGDRHTFLVAHSLLRRVLSRYADVPPRDWSFVANPWGRPEIAGPATAPPLRFSLSHTAGLVACAVGLDCECGVDVESLERRGDPLRVAPRVLAPSELADLEAQPDSERLERFLAYWTLKEAVLKALGVGLTSPARDLAFALSESEIRVECRENTAASQPEWQLASIRPTDAHVLAVAVALAGGPPRTLRVREGPPVVE